MAKPDKATCAFSGMDATASVIETTFPMSASQSLFARAFLKNHEKHLARAVADTDFRQFYLTFQLILDRQGHEIGRNAGEGFNAVL